MHYLSYHTYPFFNLLGLFSTSSIVLFTQMHTNSHVHGSYMMIASPATVIITLKVQKSKRSNYYSSFSIIMPFIFLYALLQKLPASSVVCREVYVVNGGAYFPCTFSPLKVLLLHLLKVNSFFLHRPANSMLYPNSMVFDMFCTCWILILCFFCYP